MKTNTVLDYAFFRLDSTLSRCELWISSKAGTEKLASGSFNPFLAHLKVVQQQIAAGASFVKLCPSSTSQEGNGRDCQWFSKGTLERFVRFVSTPEILERAIKLNAEFNCLKEIARSLANDCLSGYDPLAMLPATSASSGFVDSNAYHQILRNGSRDSLKEALIGGLSSAGSITKKQLIEAVDSRQHMLHTAQDIILHQAASAGFDIDTMPDLLAFANCFGAVRLRDSCLKFMSLLEERQVDCFCLNEPDFEPAFPSSPDLTASEITPDVDYLADKLGDSATWITEKNDVPSLSFSTISDNLKDGQPCPEICLLKDRSMIVEAESIPETRSWQHHDSSKSQILEASSWLVQAEELRISQVQIDETFKSRENIECNPEQMAENRAGPGYLQPEMQCYQLPSEEFLQKFVPENLSLNSPNEPFTAVTCPAAIVSGEPWATALDIGRLSVASDASSFERELLSISNNNQLIEEKGRLFERYLVYRDAKLQKESAGKKAERRERLKALQDVLDKREAEMISRRICSKKKQKLSIFHRSHLQGHTGNFDSVSQKLQGTKDTSDNSLQCEAHKSPSLVKIHPLPVRLESLSGQISGSTATPRLYSYSPKSSSTSSQSSSQNNISSPRAMTKSVNSNMSSAKHNRSFIDISATTKNPPNKIGLAHPEGSRKENTKPASAQDGQPPLQGKTGPKVGKSKKGVPRSRRTSGNAIFPLESSSLLTTNTPGQAFPSMGVKNNRNSSMRRAPAAADSKDSQSQLSLQSKAYKVSLSLAVPKNAKPFLRKGRGIGPGAGPGALKLKESVALDDIKVHNEQPLEIPDIVSGAETEKLPEAEKQSKSQSSEHMKQPDCCGSSSVTTCDLSAVEGDPFLMNSSFGDTYSGYVDWRYSSAEPAYSSEYLQGNQSGMGHSFQGFINSDDVLFNGCTAHNVPDTLFLLSSPKSTLQTHYLDHEHCAIQDMSSSICQFKPENFNQTPLLSSPTSEDACGLSPLCPDLSADIESATSDGASQSSPNSDINGNGPARQESRRLRKGFKLLLRFGRKKQNSLNKRNQGASVCVPSEIDIGKVRAGKSGCGLMEDVRIESSPTTAHRSFFSFFALRSRGAHLRL